MREESTECQSFPLMKVKVCFESEGSNSARAIICFSKMNITTTDPKHGTKTHSVSVWCHFVVLYSPSQITSFIGVANATIQTKINRYSTPIDHQHSLIRSSLFRPSSGAQNPLTRASKTFLQNSNNSSRIVTINKTSGRSSIFEKITIVATFNLPIGIRIIEIRFLHYDRFRIERTIFNVIPTKSLFGQDACDLVGAILKGHDAELK